MEHPQACYCLASNPTKAEKIMNNSVEQEKARNTDSWSVILESDTVNKNNEPKERTKPSVIPTAKFINETFDFNSKKRTRSK